MSGEFRIELDKRTWAELRKQLRIASTNLQDGTADLKDVMDHAMEPMAMAWRARLPGSLAGTVKPMRRVKPYIRAGFKSPHGDHPFLPWIEFGGTVRWHGHYSPYTRVPVFGHRSRKVMYIKRKRVAGGRYRRPAITASISESAQRAEEGIQRLLNKYFN